MEPPKLGPRVKLFESFSSLNALTGADGSVVTDVLGRDHVEA